jgi:uncharacterized cupredoxin-like copper-binding protein
MRRLVAPVAVLLLAAGPPVDWSKAETVSVIMVDDRFVPDRIVLRQNQPYQLHLENQGKDLHEFTAPEFFGAVVVRDPGALAQGGKEVLLQPQTKADVYLVPIKPGTFRLICADHDWDGMVGEIVVE